MEKRYTVRQAVTLTGVKSYVLRYWEEELELRIGRNELGHRYYTPFDIQLFLKINELKSKGLQLKAIRTLIPPEARKADTPDFSESGIRILDSVFSMNSFSDPVFFIGISSSSTASPSRIREYREVRSR